MFITFDYSSNTYTTLYPSIYLSIYVSIYLSIYSSIYSIYISIYSKKKLNSDGKPGQKLCNCRGGIHSCPMEGKCLSKSIIYKASVKARNKTCIYLGLAANTFKERLGNHKLSFNHQKCKSQMSKTQISLNISGN